ncbi:DNAse, partial [Bacillus cereus]
VPETAWFNGGNFTGTNDGNTASMLYYENRLDSWLANHPNYYLDYQVTPLYEGNELLPRQIRLAYVGIDKNGQTLSIKLGGGREKSGNGGATVVVLDNVAPNAKINYADGTAVNTVSPK